MCEHLSPILHNLQRCGKVNRNTNIALKSYTQSDSKFWLKVPSLARSVPKPLKVPSLARSVPKPLLIERTKRVSPNHRSEAVWGRPEGSRRVTTIAVDPLPAGCEWSEWVSEVKWSEVSEWSEVKWKWYFFGPFFFPETYICYRGYFNLNRYICKKCRKVSLWV